MDKKLQSQILSFLADLNGSEWIKGDGPGEVDMRQRAKSLHKMAANQMCDREFYETGSVYPADYGLSK